MRRLTTPSQLTGSSAGPRKCASLDQRSGRTSDRTTRPQAWGQQPGRCLAWGTPGGKDSHTQDPGIPQRGISHREQPQEWGQGLPCDTPTPHASESKTKGGSKHVWTLQMGVPTANASPLSETAQTSHGQRLARTGPGWPCRTATPCNKGQHSTRTRRHAPGREPSMGARANACTASTTYCRAHPSHCPTRGKQPYAAPYHSMPYEKLFRTEKAYIALTLLSTQAPTDTITCECQGWRACRQQQGAQRCEARMSITWEDQPHNAHTKCQPTHTLHTTKIRCTHTACTRSNTHSHPPAALLRTT